jgi:signal transduction histidine kinase
VSQDQPVLDRSQERLQSLLNAGRALVTELDPEVVLERLLQAARELTGAKYAALGILDDRKKELERFVTAGIDPETRLAIGDLPRGRGILGELIKHPEVLRLADIGDHPHSYGFPPGHPPMRTFLGAPVLIRGEAWGNLYLTEKDDGAEFDEGDEEAIEVLAEWAGIAIENARLYRQADERRQELETALRRSDATLDITRALGGEVELSRVLELIVKRARALVEARCVAILLAEEDELCVSSVAGDVSDSVRDLRIPIEGTVSGSVFNGRQPARFNAGETRLASPVFEATEAQSALLVPLIYRARAVGVLAAFDHQAETRNFGPEEERLLEAFGAAAATAVATAQSVEADLLRRSMAASDQERRRWARELHDETLQELAAIKVAVDSKPGTPLGEDTRQKVSDQLEHTILGLQTLITELRPAVLDELGLQAAVEALAERIKALSELAIDIDIRLPYDMGTSDVRLAPETEATAFRLIQESLSNTVKHAKARHAHVRVDQVDSSVLIDVEDDGLGFDAEARARGTGFGLLGMRERVDLAGGTVEVVSARGEGTTVKAVLPAVYRD